MPRFSLGDGSTRFKKTYARHASSTPGYSSSSTLFTPSTSVTSKFSSDATNSTINQLSTEDTLSRYPPSRSPKPTYCENDSVWAEINFKGGNTGWWPAIVTGSTSKDEVIDYKKILRLFFFFSFYACHPYIKFHFSLYQNMFVLFCFSYFVVVSLQLN